MTNTIQKKNLYNASLRVVKFGGSSMATAEAMKIAAKFLQENKNRRFAVVSAPGKPVGGASHADEQKKVTDLLLSAWDGDASALLAVQTRFTRLAEELGAGRLLAKELETLPSLLGSAAGKDYFISRGEYLSAKLFAFLTGYRFFDAAGLIFFNENGSLDEERTEKNLHDGLCFGQNGVLPGFYGTLPGGTVKTFSRGGSDITGALAAAALHASLYENMTDVSGLLEADPRIVQNPLPVGEITYERMRELSLLGAAVLHEDAVLPVKKKGIPISIGNTFDWDAPGTAVVRRSSQNRRSMDKSALTAKDRCDMDAPRLFCISGKGGFTLLTAKIENGHSIEAALGAFAACFTDCGVPLFLLEGGSGCITAFCRTEALQNKRRRLLHHLTRAITPSYITLQDGIALATVVIEDAKKQCSGIEEILAASKTLALPLLHLSRSSDGSPIAGIRENALSDFLKALYRHRQGQKLRKEKV